MSKRISIFNHKGGTGKTITAYSLGWKLSQNNYKVLLVDGDSQINLSAISLGFDNYFDYYENEETKYINIKDLLSPVFEGKPEPLHAKECKNIMNNDHIYILPGHPDFSKYEGQISLAQETRGSLPVLKNIPGSINYLLMQIEDMLGIDFTIIDMNPGLGAINQNFLISSDYIIIPTNPDPFSKMALNTLSDHLIGWVKWKRDNFHIYKDADYPLRDSDLKFLGVLHSRFNIHRKNAAQRFEEKMDEIDSFLENEFYNRLHEAGIAFGKEKYIESEKFSNDAPIRNKSFLSLARIPDFQSLIYISYSVGKPIFLLDKEDLKYCGIEGIVKENFLKKVESFDKSYDIIEKKIEFLTK